MTPCDKLLISAEKLTQGRLICHMKPKTKKSGKSETKKRICSEILVTVRGVRGARPEDEKGG